MNHVRNSKNLVLSSKNPELRRRKRKISNGVNILAIETSCDDTCVAILEIRGKKRVFFKILSNIVSSQVKIHRKWGGIYPALAKREHQKNLPQVLKKVLAKSKNPKIDLIGVTAGPGLEPCLWIGVNFAKNLAKKLKLPIIPINHIEAHIYANWLSKKQKVKNKEQIFPAICLIVSGGHSQLILIKNHGQYKILGETRDDAAGECFDKVARLLGLGYPGGPAIEAKAAKVKTTSCKLQIKLPRPMIHQKNYDFSFSGLKTAVLYDFKKRPQKIRESKTYIRKMAKEVQQAIIDVLVYKTLKAAKEYRVKSIILGGGVTANKQLRKQLKRECLKWKFKQLVPLKKFCTDNAAMIAITTYFHWLKEGSKSWKNIKVNANLRLE